MFLKHRGSRSLIQSNAIFTCLMLEWWLDTGMCCMAALTCLYCWETSTSFLDSEGEDKVLLEIEAEEEEEEAACWRIRCSISCSCWSALTKAAFSRLVCSAFRAFFWLDDMHWSQRMVPAFSFLQREVKSVLHWAQVYGSLGMELAIAVAGPRLPVWWIKKKKKMLFRQGFYLKTFYRCCKISELVQICTSAMHLQKFLHHFL